MTQEDKDILLKYLCMALPYGVMIKEEYGDYINVNLYNAHLEHLIDRISDGLDKLVLRPMSSMTDEEKKEMHNLLSPEGTAIYVYDGISMPMNHYGEFVSYEFMNRIIQYLLKNHFDFIGLIPKGLAIEVTNKNNPYKD